MAIAELEHVASLSERILDEVERAVVGKRDALELVLLGLLADGHVLIEDYPGLAKTLIARSFAQVDRPRFSRIQFTPDLMPSDVTGSSIYNQRSGDFEFRPGPIFTNLLLGDEINRAPPKTQAALLEAMQERQVTIEGHTHPLEPPVPRHRHAEPDRVRGHVPAARGAARPLPAADRRRLPAPRGRVGDARAAHRARGGRGRARRRSSSATSCSTMQRAIEHVHVSESDRPLHGRPRRGDARERAGPGGREPARLAGAAQARRAAGPRSRARLRHARRREGGRRARARAPAHAAPGALGAARQPDGRRRARCSRRVPTPPPTTRSGIVTRVRRRSSAPTPASPRSGSSRRSRSAARSSRRSPRRSRSSSPSGLALAETPDAGGRRSRSSGERAIEGEEARRVTVESPSAVPIEQLDVLPRRPPGPVASPTARTPSRCASGAAGARARATALCVRALGLLPLGELGLRARDRFGAFTATRAPRRVAAAQGLPAARARRATCSQPAQTQVFSGNQVAREQGEGIEFADLRPFVPGDRVRRINWRASARRGELWVNELHARAQRRRRPLPRHVRRGQPRGRAHARPRRARAPPRSWSTTCSTRTASGSSASAAC